MPVVYWRKFVGSNNCLFVSTPLVLSKVLVLLVSLVNGSVIILLISSN